MSREAPGSVRWWPLTFHATAVLLECVASGALFLRLLAARWRDAALRGKRSVVCGDKVLPASPVVLAAPVRAASLKARGKCGLFHRTGLHLPTQTWHRKKSGGNVKASHQRLKPSPTWGERYLHYCCWSGKTFRRETSCARSGLLETCWKKGTFHSRYFQDPGLRQNCATRPNLGAGGKGWRGPGVRSRQTDDLPGGSATWPERCGRPAWWRGGWERRTAAVCFLPQTGYSRWCDSTLSEAASCTRIWPRCCGAATGADATAATTQLSLSAPGATGWRLLRRNSKKGSNDS